MPQHRPLAPRRRPRRGSVERPINARLVRGTWLLVGLPLLLAAFIVGRPAPLPASALPPAFDTETAARLARELARDYPDRSPGSVQGAHAATWVRDQFALYGFETQVDRFESTLPGLGRVPLQNLVAVASGASPDALVFMASRDNTGVGAGANDNGSGTAALIELARAYAAVEGSSSAAGTAPAHTIVFVSTDGGAYGAVGAEHFVTTSPYRGRVVAMVSLRAIAGDGQPRIEITGDTARSPAASLVRTAAIRVLEQVGEEPRRPPALRQLIDLGFPFALGEQGPFVARGIPAITLTTAGERPPDPFTDTPERLNVQRLGELGRSAQALLASLDAGLELARGTSSYVYLGGRLVRGWSIELVLIASLLPFLIGTVDLFARCRRRRVPVLPAARALQSRVAFWLFGVALLFAGVQLGLFPRGDGRPVAPNTGVAHDWRVGGLVLLTVPLAAAWLVTRERLIPRREVGAEERLAGYSAALLGLGLVAVLVVATNPFALIFLLPSLYAWLWLPQVHERPPWLRGLLLALGATGPALLLLSFATRFDLGLDTPWYLLTLVSAGYVPWISVLLAFAWLAPAAQLAALTTGRYAPYPEPGDRPARGPVREAVRRSVLAVRHRRAPGEDRDALEG